MELNSAALFTITSVHTAFVRECPKGFYFRGERHDFWELLYVEKGELCVSEEEQVYTLTAGQVIFHKPMEFHRFLCESESVIRVITFSCSDNCLHSLADGVFLLNNKYKEQLTEAYDTIQAYCCHKDQRLAKKENVPVAGISLIAVNLSRFLLSVALCDATKESVNYTRSAEHYRAIVTALNEHVDKNLQIADVAAACCLSVSTVKKVFKTYAGIGVMEYFNNLKIVRAMELLRNNNSVREVSDQLSFSSPNYFVAVFKRICGCCPSEYKKHPENAGRHLV